MWNILNKLKKYMWHRQNYLEIKPIELTIKLIHNKEDSEVEMTHTICWLLC